MRYEQLMEQFGRDMGIYVRAICETVVITVPKAVVHCMVKRSQSSLLDKLFEQVRGRGAVLQKKFVIVVQDGSAWML